MPFCPRKPLFRASLAFILCAVVGGCATPGGPEPTFTKATAVPASAANGGIVVGKSTKSDVIAALGTTTAILFDSGYEVWVYHLASGGNGRSEPVKSEFVVLFAPSGVVAKTRIKPATREGADRQS